MKIKNNNLISSVLYIVPTPIGNLDDITKRSILILKNVNYILAEHIRKTQFLLKKLNIKKKILLYNNYNEKNIINIILNKLYIGYNIALVSDAGTPLINDPGYNLVLQCIKLNIKVIPLPGPCAAITALSASGLTTNRFCYEGFFPLKQNKRRNYLKKIINETRTLIFYETSNRIINTLNDILDIYGPLRHVVIAKELTKIWENILGAPIKKLLKIINKNKNLIKGEIVVLISGNNLKKKKKIDYKIKNTLKILLKEISIKKTIKLTSKIYNIKKNILYKHAIKIINK